MASEFSRSRHKPPAFIRQVFVIPHLHGFVHHQLEHLNVLTDGIGGELQLPYQVFGVFLVEFQVDVIEVDCPAPGDLKDASNAGWS